MKALKLIIFLCILTFANISPAFAQEPAPTPTPPPQVQWVNNFTVEDKPSSIITLLQDFIAGFDSFMGGFIFYTPNPFGETIKLKDNTEIPGVTKYRDIFNQLAIPIIAISIAVIAVSKIGSDNLQELKSFGIRFLITVVLFLTVPAILSYSIQFNNLLVDKITTTQQFTGFLNDYLDSSEEKIQAGNESEQYGIPSYDVSMNGGVLKSFGKFIVQTFLFILTFLFLLGGFVYIGFQFVIRFASLVFLGVLYPIIIPFALSERTQGIVNTFFKTWFTFLIQQPAFVLGFAIANDIFSSILSSKGPTVGMLFFYTGFLFFLGGVNMLVGRIFGDTWGSFATNMQSAMATRAVTGPVQSQVKDFQRGLIGGSLGTVAGHFVRDQILKNRSDSKENEFYGGGGSTNKNTYSNETSSHTVSEVTPNSQKTRFSRDLEGKGLNIQTENAKQGIVAISGEAYKHEDKQTGLTSYYPTRMEAVQDGVSEDKLETVQLEEDRFIDLSTFSKKNPNPHHYNAMQESQKQGKAISYAYVTKSSPPEKVRNFLDVSQKRNSALGIKGVIIERHGKETADSIIRMYSYNKNEKRKNI